MGFAFKVKIYRGPQPESRDRLSVRDSMLTLGGGRKSSPGLLLGVVIRTFHRLIEKSCHLFTDSPVHTHPTSPLVCFQLKFPIICWANLVSLASPFVMIALLRMVYLFSQAKRSKALESYV